MRSTVLAAERKGGPLVASPTPIQIIETFIKM